MILFDTFPLIQFSKFNNFHWVCWFLGKNLSNFVSPAWKINNPYYHTVKIIRWVRKYQSPHSLEKYISKEQFYFDFSSHFMFCECFIDFSWKPLHIKTKIYIQISFQSVIVFWSCKKLNFKKMDCDLFVRYSWNKITTTQIQISRQNWNGLFSTISHQIVSRAKSSGIN